VTIQPGIFIADWSLACALGEDRARVEARLFSPNPPGLTATASLDGGRIVPAGRLGFPLPALPDSLAAWDSANNRLILHCLQALNPAIEQAKAQFGAHRLGVVLGSSTSGIASTESALRHRLAHGDWPASFTLGRWELGDPAAFAAAAIGAQGPAWVVSTACTSSTKAIISAARLLATGICDAVLTGGADTLCDLTLNGFAALNSLSPTGSNPFSRNRDGIGLGEGSALFLLTRTPSPLRLAGWGESGDAHHASAPDPEGKGAVTAMRAALASAGLDAEAIGYLNLHGTGTRLNDAAEATAMHQIFGAGTPMSSTKGHTGHMLGATGAVEAAFTLMALQRREIPPHLWDHQPDPGIAPLRLIDHPGHAASSPYMASFSAGFGGSNAALILARTP
jgi:3-oxoacyl-[acyl-carrier-protein] synthase-1